jgi:hypothetical protein
MSKKPKKAAPIQGPDALLEEAARDLDTFESRRDSRLATLARAMEVFNAHMGDVPGYDYETCAIKWDDEGEGVYLVEAQDHGVMLANANPSGEWAVYLDSSVLELVGQAVARTLARKAERRAEITERANALLEDAALDREGCGE